MKLIKNDKFLVLSALFFILFSFTAEAAPKRHKITIGMFNTYSIKDGNLGSREPDLKEVWAGMPGVSDYEACNMTMHYWPRPGDLPDVEYGENPYTEWWKSYMEEAYNLTNQNGEIRLKVIVGPLYSYYEAYKGEVFDKFVEELCRWEKGSKFDGTLAGWYLAEEPMGSTHNYDPNICNEMAEAIKAVEKNVGAREHQMYMDVTISGKYYSPTKLADFTRNVDVIMISASPFLWTTSSQQPVYETSWKRIHQSTKEVRKIVNSSRKREIHVVLEARDAIGHGQPTNWEMRQQIHDALSYSNQYEDPPVDGIWFFWWSEIGRNKKTDADDWNNSRRIAEAIQVQVPRSTFTENIKSDSDPSKSRFTFSQFGSFNPTNSCIPYDLAESGNVQISVHNEKMSLVRIFDMKYQVAGSLGRFGGPFWRRSGLKNGNYIFRLYVNSRLMDEVKKRVQWSLTLNSTSHQPGVWSKNNTIIVQWEPLSEEIVGILGYSVLWDTSLFSYPDDQIELEPDITEINSPPLPDGENHYFHITTIDGEGNQVSVDHLGPFFIDTTSPGKVNGLSSSSHEVEKWSKENRVILQWNPAEDSGSGINGYSVLWDQMPGTLPDKEMDIPSELTVLASEPLIDGIHYFHIRSVDNMDNWSNEVTHIGPFLIDRSKPAGVKNLISVSHTPGQWSNNDMVTVKWEPAEDLTSGIAGYSILWDNFPDTDSGKSINLDRKNTAISPFLESSKNKAYYFHINSMDMAGNWSDDIQHIGPFMIDIEQPGKIQVINSPSHKSDEWSNQAKVDLTWPPAIDNISGIAGYEWSLSEAWKAISDTSIHIPKLDDGIWNIRVRAVDKAGNKGEPGNISLKIDSETPSKPNLWSSSHPNENVWYISPGANFQWTSEDNLSGIAGYSWKLDNNPLAIPDLETTENSMKINIPQPGIWYFHIRAEDNAGNFSNIASYKIQFDPTAPPEPKIISDTHINSEWSRMKNVMLSWEIPNPGPGGIEGYAYLLDKTPLSLPEEIIVSNSSRIDYPGLADGSWYFHCRGKSNSGIWGAVSHFKIMIDTVPPIIEITYPEDGKWNTQSITEYRWKVDEYTSGVDPATYEYSYNKGAWTTFNGNIAEIPDCIESEGDKLQIKVKDYAGNLGISREITIRVDLSAMPPVIISNTHTDQNKWHTDNSPEFIWSFEDKISGVDGYSWVMDNMENTDPPEIKMIDENITTKTDIDGLADGIWYFHLRGVDKAGNWSQTSHYRVKIDSTFPTAKVKISGPSVVNSNTPIVRQGPVALSLQISEEVSHPVLEFLLNDAAWPIKLAFDKGEWKGSFDVTIHTGDGEANFIFSAKDKAGNVGHEIISGGTFVIDTLISADSDKTSEVLCVSEPGTKLIIPPNSISQDMRVEILKSPSSAPGIIAIYDFIPYNNKMKVIKDLIFRKTVELKFPAPERVGLYCWDGVKWHKIQDIDDHTNAHVDYLGRFTLMKSEPLASKIIHGWATPNPFTPNSSGDSTDRVIFHVATPGNKDFEVRIYDINGRLVKCLDNGMRIWDGRNEDDQIVEGGLYIYQIRSGEDILSGTVVVLK